MKDLSVLVDFLENLTGLAYMYANENMFSCFRTFIGNPVYYDAKMTCDELAGKVRKSFQLQLCTSFMDS